MLILFQDSAEVQTADFVLCCEVLLDCRSTDTADFVLCCEVLLDCRSVMQKTNFGLFYYSIIKPSSEEKMCARLTQVIFRT